MVQQRSLDLCSVHIMIILRGQNLQNRLSLLCFLDEPKPPEGITRLASTSPGRQPSEFKAYFPGVDASAHGETVSRDWFNAKKRFLNLFPDSVGWTKSNKILLPHGFSFCYKTLCRVVDMRPFLVADASNQDLRNDWGEFWFSQKLRVGWPDSRPAMPLLSSWGGAQPASESSCWNGGCSIRMQCKPAQALPNVKVCRQLPAVLAQYHSRDPSDRVSNQQNLES